MKIYRRAYNASVGQFLLIETEAEVTFKSFVQTYSELPTGEELDATYVTDTNHLYVYQYGVWVDQGRFDYSDLLQQMTMQELS